MPEKDAVRKKIERAKMLTLVSILAGASSLVLALLVIFPGIVYTWAGLDIYALALVPYMMTVIFAITATIYGVLASKAAREEEDKKLLEQRKENTSAFDVNEDVRFTAERSFKNYKKYAPPVLALIGASTIALALFLYWRYWGARIEAPIPASPMHAAFVSAIFMCISVFGGAFCIGQSRMKDFRWLRPVGAWLVMAFIVTLLATLTALMHKFQYPQTDYYVRNVVFVFFIILGAEFVINFISEFYRPRTLEEERPVFESRLLALFTEPGGVVRNIADTLDYQFGFKVSGTWIYSFLEKSLAPLVIAWLVALWLFTCIAEVGPNEIGVRERFGRITSNKPLSPGVYLKLPWPFGNIARYSSEKVQEIIIGPDMKDKKGEIVKPPVVLWTKSHYGKESRYLVASEKEADSQTEGAPVSYLSVSIPVQFKIHPDKIIDYAYKNQDPKIILKNLGEAVTTKYLASVDMLKVMSVNRQKTVNDLKKLFQEAADKQDLGIDILFVNLHDAHPPVGKVADAFEDVIGAREEKEAAILNAKAYQETVIPEAEGNAIKLKLEAEAYKNDQIKVAEAESGRFNKQLQAYNEMPGMFKLRTYLDFLENDCKDIRKYVLSSQFPYEIYEINLEKKTRLDLLDADLGNISGK